MSENSQEIGKTETQQSILQLLRHEIEGSDEYRQEIIKPVNQHFRKRWDPNCMVPNVAQVWFRLAREDGDLTLEGKVSVQFDGWQKWYSGQASVPFPWDECPTSEETKEKYRIILLLLVRRAGARIMSSLPSNMEEELRAHVSSVPDPKQLYRVVRDLAKDVRLTAMLKAKLPAVQADYERRMDSTPCPPGFRPVHISSLDLRCTCHAGYVDAALLICMDNGSTSQKKILIDVIRYAFYKNPEKQRDALYRRMRKGAKTLLDGLIPVPLLYAAPSLHALRDMTEPIETLLQKGATSLGCVTVHWGGPRYKGGPVLYQPALDSGKVRYGTKNEAISDWPAVLLNLELLQHPRVPLGDVAAWPQSPVELYQLGASLRKAINQTLLGRKAPFSSVQLQADERYRLTLRCGTDSFPLCGSQNPPGTFLQELVHQICRAEKTRPGERQAQLKALNALNPTELYVLRYITANGETALPDVVEVQESAVKAYVSACLRHLTEMEVPVDGHMAPLLRVRTAAEDKCLYRVGASLTQEVLASAAGRPYTAAEAANLIPPQRERWFTDYLLGADDAQRWTRFGEALDDMPRTFLADFAKSEAGQAFLRRFTGDEAVFVRLTVEALPGCKRLAAKLWPEECDGKAGKA